MSSNEIRSEAGARIRAPASRAWVSFSFDLALASLVALTEIGPVIADAPPWDNRSFAVMDAVRLAGFSVPLLFRRRYPVIMLAAVVVSFAGSELLGPGLAVAFYSLGAWCEHETRSRLAAALGVAAVATTFVIDRNVGVGSEILIILGVFGGAWYLGGVSRVRRDYTAVLEERARRLERDQQEAAQRAASAERTRIARELHDIVAHRVSMMTIQASAAGVVAQDDPDAAQRAMATVEDTGRQTLSELRRLVGVLRAEEDADSALLAPTPCLRDLETMVGDVQAAGLPVRLTVVGTVRPLAQSLEISVYRIVQEALTNVMKHAGPQAEADVVVRYEPEAVEVEVSDTGAGPTGRSGGYGLVGMAERVAVFGGRLESGARPGGGFTVRAHLPIGAPPK